MATYASTYGNPDWYKQQIDPKDAQNQANRLGISTDQLFQLYAQTNMPNIGQPGQQGMPSQGQQGQPGGGQQWTIPSGGLRPTQEQMAQWASGMGRDRAFGAPLPQLIAAPPSASGTALSGMYGPMATWQNVTGQGQGNQGGGTFTPAQLQQLGQQMSQFQVPQQVVPKLTGQTIVPTAQPGAQPVVPVKQFQSGGLVTQGNAYGTQYPLYAVDAQGNRTGNPVYANATNQASLLGAAALGIGGGYSPVVINPPPSGTPSSKSGVAPTGGALVGTSTPQVGWGTNEASWDQLAQTAGLSGSDISEFAKAGYTPAQVAQKLNVATPLGGPWTNPQIGSVFTPVARTAPTMALGATPLTPAAQPTATAYNPTPAPFAQAPPAPGLQIPQTIGLAAGQPPVSSPLLAAHTDALADAGKALFAHFGGDPNSAGPADIMHFHNQLTGALAAAPQPTAAKKMASGGRVPGRGNKDTVPALLTPGEYVIPKPQVQQLMRTGRLPIKMAGGGTVQDPDPDPNAPPEARRKTLTTAAQTQSTPPPAAPGGGYSGSSLVPGLAAAAQAYSSSMANLPRNPIGSGTGVDIRNTRLDPDPDLPSLKAAGMLGSGPGSGQPTATALGGIGSGLTQAAQAIASSVKPWQMQQSAIPAPPPAPPAPQLTQPQVAQQAQQGVNPYAAYIANQARYPASPYYT
jgi:hypothetical protein